ncbi:MAG: tRNA pseudouridine(38-40) synthase TruA [Candidatus Marinimicrobia bacterium]|nr:tRNA pseudouridine(38-40) synthase TruA [Candidatus Neomarinimicrobiota bacterium]MCF7839161.1 tRNA pseudouridine(38-40) synthase TruA [Candidatus Neomarinimicrobiota bacterium]MCF7903424.1 tRNA pseudouridine(38-40) synthase TruA [Candidatus Neomarinimicrobiota bacterium]
MRVALSLEFEGTNYQGWQSQPTGPTIQSVLEQALESVTKYSSRITGSGRTDAGVHALGQVAHFDTDAMQIPIDRLPAALNQVLPDDISVLAAQPVPDDFNSRFDAVGREYEYHIVTYPRALQRQTSWYCKYPLDADLLNACAEMVLGEHDFTSFCAAITDTKNMICNVEVSAWEIHSRGMIYRVRANRFLHHMVRMLVGNMIEVARGRWSMAYFRKLLQHPDHEHDTVTAPAQGLILKCVYYPDSLHLFQEFCVRK